MHMQTNIMGDIVDFGWQLIKTPTVFYVYIFHDVESFIFLFYA